MAISAGVTATREGMTTSQWQAFEEQLKEFDILEWHDGDCIGGDTQAHGSVRKLFPEVSTNGHPCNLEKYRAWNEYDILQPVKAPLVRNRDIVDAVDQMFAAPKEYEEVLRGSGTWATIRYARRQKKPLIIIWPDGTYDKENM